MGIKISAKVSLGLLGLDPEWAYKSQLKSPQSLVPYDFFCIKELVYGLRQQHFDYHNR